MTIHSVPAPLVSEKKPTRNSLARRILATLLVWIVSLLVKTFRVSLHGPEPTLDGPTVFAFHHGRQMGLLRHPRPRNTIVLTSWSHDGALQALILGALGFDIVRGSSSRGGDAGLIATIRAMRQGAAAAFAVDGPQGPMGVVKPGALYLAQATKGVIIPVTCAASRCLRLSKSWDKFMVPAPWSRVALVRGHAMTISLDRNGESIDEARSKLERKLDELTKVAETLVIDERRRDT